MSVNTDSDWSVESEVLRAIFELAGQVEEEIDWIEQDEGSQQIENVLIIHRHFSANMGDVSHID